MRKSVHNEIRGVTAVRGFGYQMVYVLVTLSSVDNTHTPCGIWQMASIVQVLHNYAHCKLLKE